MKFFDKIKNAVRIGTLLFMLILTVGAMAVFAATDGNGSSSYSFSIIKQVEGLPYPGGMKLDFDVNGDLNSLTVGETGTGEIGSIDLNGPANSKAIKEILSTIAGFDVTSKWTSATVVNFASSGDPADLKTTHIPLYFIESDEERIVTLQLNIDNNDPDLTYNFKLEYGYIDNDDKVQEIEQTISLSKTNPSESIKIPAGYGEGDISYKDAIPNQYKFQVITYDQNDVQYGTNSFTGIYYGTGNTHAGVNEYNPTGIVYLPNVGGKIKLSMLSGVTTGTYRFQILRKETSEGDPNRLVKDAAGNDTFILSQDNNYSITVDVPAIEGEDYTEYAVYELGNSYCESATLITQDFGKEFHPYLTNGGTVTVTNTYTPQKGVLAVSKTVTGADANKDDKFNFKVTLLNENGGLADITTTDGDEDTVGYGMPFVNGVAEFTLKDGEYKMAVNLPDGLRYTVEETDSRGYTTSYTTTVGEGKPTSGTGTTATGTIVDKTVVDVAFTNSTDEPEPTPTPPPTSTTGTYKYVHEYYLQNPDGSLTLEGTSSIGSSDSFKLPNSTQYTEADVTKVPEYGAYTYEYFDDAYGTTTGSKTYQETEGKTYVTATSSGNQIIILRYVRTLTGSYHVVHEYYFKDAEGGLTLEGTSDISTVEDLPLDGTEYTENSVLRKPYFGEYTYTYDNAGYGTMTGDEDDPYAPDEAMEYVVSTENGEQIIILRYIRELTGTYKYVHEYYYQDKDGNLTLEGTSDIGSSDRIGLPSDSTYNESNVTKVPEYNGKTYTYTEDAYGTTNEEGYDPDAAMEYVVATEDGTEIIILRYVRTEPDGPNDEKPAVGSYRYVHEYYFVDSDGTWEFEGRSDIHDVTGLPLDSTRYYASGVERVTSFEGRVYTHIQDAYGTTDGTTYSPNSAMKYVVTTEDGEQIIILVYIRALNPHTPPPPDLPDPNDPDSPDEFDFFDEDVPLSYLKLWDPEEEEWFWLPEPDIPLAWLDPDPEEEVEEPEDPVPQSSEEPEQPEVPEVPEELEESVIPNTGDNSHTALWGVLAAVSLAGIAVLRYVEHRGKEK